MIDAPFTLLDVGPSQGLPDWARVAACGRTAPGTRIDGAFVKLTEGASGAGSLNPHGVANVRAARDAGLPARGYHFFSPFSEASAQSDHLLELLHQADDGWAGDMLLPMIDVERSIGASGKFPKVENLLAFLEMIEADIGAPPLLYSAGWVSTAMGLASHPELTRCSLMVSSFTHADPPICPPWGAWGTDAGPIGWQFTGKGHVDGIAVEVDVSRFRSMPMAAPAG